MVACPAACRPGTKRNVSLHRTPLQKQVEAYIKHNKLKQTHISGEVGINKSLLSIWLRGKVSAKQDQVRPRVSQVPRRTAVR